MTKPMTTVSSRIAWTCPWYDIRQDEIIRPDGSPGVYNIVQKSAAVWIVPITSAGEIIMLKQYRYTVDDWCWEIPAGSVEEGQTPFAAAQEELREEIGGRSDDWTYVGQLYTANGISNEVGHIFIAHNVEVGQAAPEAAEVIEIHPKLIDEVVHMAQNNQINDGSSALAILLCQNHLKS